MDAEKLIESIDMNEAEGLYLELSQSNRGATSQSSGRAPPGGRGGSMAKDLNVLAILYKPGNKIMKFTMRRNCDLESEVIRTRVRGQKAGNPRRGHIPHSIRECESILHYPV